MLRLIGGIIAGVAGWLIIVTILNFGLRYGIAGYSAVEKSMAFTLPMMIGRLSISAVSSLASGAIAAAVGRRQLSAWLAGFILFFVFAPYHVLQIWNKFPGWYHIVFLSSLVLLSILGGLMVRTRAPE